MARIDLAVYLTGLVIFGAVYDSVKIRLGGGPLFLLAVLAYLLLLRFVGTALARWVAGRRSAGQGPGKDRRDPL